MNKTYFAAWEDGTFSFLTANSMVDLFDKLDKEGDPLASRIFEVPPQFHVGTEIFLNFPTIDIAFFDASQMGQKPQPVEWPADIQEQWNAQFGSTPTPIRKSKSNETQPRTETRQHIHAPMQRRGLAPRGRNRSRTSQMA